MAEHVQTLSKPLRTPADLEAAVRALLNTWPAIEDSRRDQHVALAKVSAELCTACQKSARINLAQSVLQLAVKFGQLDEAAYFAHNPLPVVKSLMPYGSVATELKDSELRDAHMEDASAEMRHAIFVKRLEDAANLFLPAFSSPSVMDVPLAKIVTVGKRLLECAFAARHNKLINSIYLAIAKYPRDITELSQWYNEQLQKSGDYELLVSSFIACPPTVNSLSKEAYLQIGDRVVEATGLTHDTQAGAVLETLLTITASSSYMLRTTWVTDLLYGQWQKTKDFNEIMKLFAKIAGLKKGDDKLASTVVHTNGIYRVMIQIALEADKTKEANALFAELKAAEPTAANDIRIIGLFALAKAKAGNWLGVQDDFQKAADAAAANPKNEGGRLPARDAERVFVPIAKEYVRTHTIGETEDFLKQYIEEIGVPIGRHMVTLIANEYGALREVRSFIAWLDYCTQAGFVADASFSNAILHNCRKHWMFGFRELRAMYRKLRLLSPNFEDKVTQTIMTHAAVSDARNIGSAGREIRTRAHSPQTKSVGANGNNANGKRMPASFANMATLAHASPLSVGRHLLDEHDLYVAMKEAFAAGTLSKAVRMYKHAVRGGMPPSEKCLKLAVSCAIKSELLAIAASKGAHKEAPHFDVAVDLLKSAHMAGQNIDGATAYLAIAYIEVFGSRQVATTGRTRKSNTKASVAAAVKSVLLRLNASKVNITDLALNRAAFHMYKAGHMSGAIALAMSAANTSVGGGRPGYNAWNFSTLLQAYARNVDAEGIRTVTQGAVAADILRELMAYKTIKQVHRRVRASLIEHECEMDLARRTGTSSDGVEDSRYSDLKKSLQAVEEVLALARAARQKLSDERRELEMAAIRIMQQAALDAGHKPVDLDTVRIGREQEKRKRGEHGYQQQHDQHQEDGDGTSSIASVGSISSGSTWDMLDMPVDEDGRLINAEEEKLPAAAGASY